MPVTVTSVRERGWRNYPRLDPERFFTLVHVEMSSLGNPVHMYLQGHL